MSPFAESQPLRENGHNRCLFCIIGVLRHDERALARGAAMDTPGAAVDGVVAIDRYGEVLTEYLRTRDERELFQASLLSNDFVESGVGPDEIIALHVEALDQALEGATYREQARAIGDAHQFLLDVMIAYGLKYREYFELKQHENERAAEARDEILATIA